MAATSCAPRATHSSSCSAARWMPAAARRRRSRLCNLMPGPREGAFRCASGCTPGRRRSSVTSTSASMSTAPPGSPARRTAARYSSRKRRARSAIAQALAISSTGGRRPIDALLEHLHDKRTLLVLDNFEQLLPAAPLAIMLLEGSPGLRVLVSSRSVLRVYGEQEFPVPPLAVPDLKALPSLSALSQFEAVRLFIERAVAVKPDFRATNENAPAIAGICERVDGLPLAIELAAARIKLFSPQALLSRLEKSLTALGSGARDLPSRHQTLRAAIQG